MNYPLFNNKNRVKKLLSQVWPNDQKDQPQAKRQKVEHTQKDPPSQMVIVQKVEAQPKEKILQIKLPPAYWNDKVYLDEHEFTEVFLEDTPPIEKSVKCEEEQEISVVREPKDSWIKGMKIIEISKSKNKHKNKQLVFYH